MNSRQLRRMRHKDRIQERHFDRVFRKSPGILGNIAMAMTQGYIKDSIREAFGLIPASSTDALLSLADQPQFKPPAA